jgi:hypothetical protein
MGMASERDELARGVRRRDDSRRWVRRVGSIALAAAALVGCKATPPVESTHDEAAQLAAGRAISAQAESLRALATFEATGVCRLRVPREDSGFDEEQLDLLLVLERPLRTALRLKLSVSDTLAWLGSDGEQWWLFLPEESPPIAYRGRIAGDAKVADDRLERAPIPRSLRDPRLFWLLAGLEPPREPTTAPEWDPTRSAWVLEEPFEVFAEAEPSGESAGSPLQVRRGFNPQGEAVFVEVFEADGRRVAASALSEHGSVEVDGKPLGAWPRVATRISLEGEAPGDGRAMLVLERPSGRGGRVKPALFEWSRLAASMRPERIVEVGP